MPQLCELCQRTEYYTLKITFWNESDSRDICVDCCQFLDLKAEANFSEREEKIQGAIVECDYCDAKSFRHKMVNINYDGNKEISYCKTCLSKISIEDVIK